MNLINHLPNCVEGGGISVKKNTNFAEAQLKIGYKILVLKLTFIKHQQHKRNALSPIFLKKTITY